MAISLSIVSFPILSFLLLLFFNKKLGSLIGLVGIGGIFFSFIATFFLWLTTSLPFDQHLWQFLPAQMIFQHSIDFGLRIDSLSLTMALVVSFVSTLIAIYSFEYMKNEQGYARFFAGINLFVFFMQLLVLADSLWLLFIGWEGVGLASYLLIGFFYREPQAVSAAMKAFLTTRVGDVFLVFAMFLSASIFHTLNIETMLDLSKNMPSSDLITITCLCLTLAACGKSAQLPLQTWLADAMWGPTPVSALIHAATMVTAGVYLLVRMSFLLVLSPVAQVVIMGIGLATLIMAGLCALVQSDMKRVLAYSTMSQIGYMFLAVGALSFQAAIFHLVTHAFFKALLFLSAGIIGHAVHSYDLFQMGGLRKSMPVVFVLFLIGSASLMGLPFLGAGFFSKEWILNDIAFAPNGTFLFSTAVFGTFLTSLYTVRMLKLAFFGTPKKMASDHFGILMYFSVFVLAFFSLFIGFLETPILGAHFVSDFLRTSVPALDSHHLEFLWMIPTFVAVMGAIIAARVKNSQKSNSFLKNGFGFNQAYQNLLVSPYQKLADVLAFDVVKKSYDWVSFSLDKIFSTVALAHTGKLSHYMSFMIFAMVALSSIMVISCY